MDEIVEFVSSMLDGDHISAGFAEFLHRCTDGLPLALEESIRLMHDRADLIRRGDGWVRRHLDNLDVPPTIRDAVLERAARLGADAQAVLRAAAVLTDPVDQAVLADVAELPAERFAAGLAEALGCGLLGEDSRGLLSFRHGLVCQVVYEAVPAPERRRRHQLAGEALAGLTPVPVVALVRHFPGCGQTEAWCRYAEQAADLCRQAGDEATAGTLLHDVITGVRLPVDVLIRLVRRIQYTSFSHPDRFIELIQVLESVLDTRELTRGEQAALRYQIGRLYMVTGAYAAGQAQMKQVVPVLPTGSAEAIRARIFLGVPLGAVRPVAEHLRWLREMPEIPPSIPPDERLRLTADRIFALLLLGEEPAWTQAWQLPQRAGTPEEASALAAAYRNLGHMAMPGTYLPGAEWTPDRWISVCPVCRQGDKLYVYLAGGIPANDREKWMSSGDIKTEFSLSRDGVELPLTSEPIPSYELAPEPATYTLHTVHHNGFSGFQYGKTVRTGWTFQSGQVDTDNVTDPYLCVRKFLGGSGACGWQPLILLDYGLYLGLDDTARAGKPFSFTVRPWQPDQAHPAPIADVRVSVSYDDGAHWTKALVRKESGDTFRVRITHPRLDRTTGAVSIRTEVSNTAGNTVTQQIDRAYGLTDAHGGTGGHRLDIEP